MFVIPCRFDPKRPTIYRCVYEIKRWHPKAEVVVVDSASPDRSYMSKLRELGITVADAENTNYEVGALWHAFENYPRDRYFLCQDSAFVQAEIESVLDRHPISGMMYWRGWEGCQPEHIAAGRELCALTDYSYLDDGFSMVFGCMLFARREILERFRAKNLHRALPTDKVGSCAMERVLGIALAHEGFTAMIPRSFFSTWVSPHQNNDGTQTTRVPNMEKLWLNRV